MVLVWGEVVERLVWAAMVVMVDVGCDFGPSFGEGGEGVNPRALILEGADETLAAAILFRGLGLCAFM